jgi:CRISPR-associated endoribonuclease Cas6
MPVVGVDPTRVRLEHVHAAFSRWFDRSPAEHAANDKPYTVSPLTRDERGRTGVEIATLTETAGRRLREATADGATVRLGNQTRPVGAPEHLIGRSWAQLAENTTDDRWQLEFLTPTTFRSGDRASPLPHVGTVMNGLARTWNACSDTRIEPPAADAAHGVDSRADVVDCRTDTDVNAGADTEGWGAVWVSGLDLRSVTVSVRVRRRDGSFQPITVSAALGSLTLRCDDSRAAARAGPLLQLAAYCGVGGMTGKGFGVTRVRAHHRLAYPPVSMTRLPGGPGPVAVAGHGPPG